MSPIITSSYFRGYLFSALEESPVLLKHILEGADEELFDKVVDPSRFTLRQAIAHLADWETVYQERFRLVVDELDPTLPNIDEGARAIDRKYETTDWKEQLELYRSRRAETIAYLKPLPQEAWIRTGRRPEIGHLSLLDLVQLLPLHDLYHLRQAREYGLA